MSEKLANLFNKIRNPKQSLILLRSEVNQINEEELGVWTEYINSDGERVREFTIFDEDGIGKVISTLIMDPWGFI